MWVVGSERSKRERSVKERGQVILYQGKNVICRNNSTHVAKYIGEVVTLQKDSSENTDDSTPRLLLD